MIFERFIRNSCGIKGLRIRHAGKEDLHSPTEDTNLVNKGAPHLEHRLDKLHSSTASTIVKTDILDFSDDESITDTRDVQHSNIEWSSRTLDTWDRAVVVSRYLGTSSHEDKNQTCSTFDNQLCVPFKSVVSNIRRSRFNSSDACSQTSRKLKVFLSEACQVWPFRVRVISPRSGTKGWVRGASAEVKWTVLDPTITTVRIDVCNTGWKVPTTITVSAPNDGYFTWRKVAWGMPSGAGYYLNIYSWIHKPDEGKEEMYLIAQSDEFELIN